jgi:hypothetical protein
MVIFYEDSLFEPVHLCDVKAAEKPFPDERLVTCEANGKTIPPPLPIYQTTLLHL